MLWGEGTSWFKIGFTCASVGVRARQVEGGVPFRILVLGHRPGSRHDEIERQRSLAEYRTRGEWFSLPEERVWSLLQWLGVPIPDERDIQKAIGRAATG